MRLHRFLLSLVMVATSIAACGDDGSSKKTELTSSEDQSWATSDEDPFASMSYDQEYFKPLTGETAYDGKADSAYGTPGPSEDGLDPSTAVWEVTTTWDSLDPAAGLAWSANSGLTWSEKFSQWIDSLEQFESVDPWGRQITTFELTTPWGKTLPSPRLECAETAFFLRTAFASWYGLPFYTKSGSIFFGHFGVVDLNGEAARLSADSDNRFPAYAAQYNDFTEELSNLNKEEIVAQWPQDTRLRSRHLADDDNNTFLGDEAGAGAYFDEVFLNKRVGYFMRHLLLYNGSIHLIHTNTFNLKPRAIKAGDIQLHRWQARGIGHTIVVKNVAYDSNNILRVNTLQGSMPRVQPYWFDADRSESDFIGEDSGGEGMAELGGGLKRWR